MGEAHAHSASWGPRLSLLSVSPYEGAGPLEGWDEMCLTQHCVPRAQ